jgi:hypothetical protein
MATLEIVKVALGGGATFNFTASGDNLPGSFTVNGNSKAIFPNLMPGGSRTVTEGALPSHWDFTSLTCGLTVLGDGTTSSYTSGPTATITNLGAGDTLTCTYTNTKRGEIRIIKGAVGGEGTDTFNFTSTGGLPSPAVGGNFSLTPPKGGTASVTFSDLTPGKYSVTEDTSRFGTGLTDWKLASVVCSATGSGSSGAQDGTDPRANIDVGPGGSVTCTFTNVRGSNYVTDTMFCALPNDQFRLIYQPDVAYTLTASNPGQFYDNLFYQGAVGSSVTFNIGIPYPFVTQGAVPIQVHSSVTVTQNGCLVPVGDLTGDPTTRITVTGANGENNSLSSSGNPVIVLGDYGTSPKVGETPTTVTVSATTPSTGLVYVTIHLDYGMKGTGGWSKGTNDLATNKSLFANWPVYIADPQKYGFSSTVIDGGGSSAPLMESVSSVNDFKRNLGFAGQVTSSGGTPIPGVKVEIFGPTGSLLGSAVTDEDGWYVFSYKYSGKEASFTVKLPVSDYVSIADQQTVTLKSNGFARVDFTVP